MVDCHQRMIKGEGRSTALREGQQAVMATLPPGIPTAFIPIGNWTPRAAKGG